MKRTRIYRGDVDDLVLPDHLADWDVHDYWERERFDSMAAHLTEGDILWVIGAEHGYMAALWSRLVGDTVLVEPSEPFWSNIRLIWEHNRLRTPRFTVQALASDRPGGPPAALNRACWPACTGVTEQPAQAYRYLHNPSDAASTPQITLDDLAAKIGVPSAISIDIEGAEVVALEGARGLLSEIGPELWVSVHPDLIERDYPPYAAADVHVVLTECGYESELLAIDHEEHWHAWKP